MLQHILILLLLLDICGAFVSCRAMLVFRSRLFSTVSKAGFTPGRTSAAVINSCGVGTAGKVADKTEFVTSPPKGTRDFYPDDFRMRTWLHNKWKDTSDKFGFEQYDAPILESEDLYVRKAGEEITQQLYNFKDKGGRQLSLRPEMTPSLARMVLAKGKSIQLPLKWCSIPQCWRYERMSRGRRREHFQWNLDIWGVQGVGAEAELLAAVISCFQSLGLSEKDVGIKINNRKVLNAVMSYVGISEDLWVPACVLIDKLDKQTPASLAPEFAALGLRQDTVDQLLQHLQLKTLDEFSALLGEDCEGVRELRRLFELLLQGYGVSAGWVEFNCSVVRGLAYYTGTVFEGFDKKGQLRAICGGGRYDSLLSSMGAAQSIPAVGFGFGDAVIMELLQSLDLLPQLEGPGAAPAVDVVVYAMDEGLRTKALALASQLRQDGLRVDVVLDERKPKWALQRADRSRAPVLLMLAGEEHSCGQVVVKNLQQRRQVTIAYENVSLTVRDTLNTARLVGGSQM